MSRHVELINSMCEGEHKSYENFLPTFELTGAFDVLQRVALGFSPAWDL